MAKLGILFDIDELGGGLYGYATYKIFFNAVDTNQLSGCSLYDGNTNLTPRGQANHYCIAIESLHNRKLAFVRDIISKCYEKGLLPFESRSLEDPDASNEPLVLACHIDLPGNLIDCNIGWISQAWKERRKKTRNLI